MKVLRLVRASMVLALGCVAVACSGGSSAPSGSGTISPPTGSPSASTTPATSPTPATVLATWPNPAVNGRIAFGRWLDASQTTRAILVINPDGTGERQLTQPAHGVEDNQPDWSPDGSKIAFERCAARCEAWVMNADGSGAKRLGPDCEGAPPPDCEDRSAPAWSPDGTMIAVDRATGDVQNDTIKSSELALIDAETGEMIRLVDETAPYSGDTGNAGWAPDGARLVLTRSNSATGEPPNAKALFVIDADGNGLRQLTEWDLSAGDHPVWSPDGQLILFRAVSGSDDQYGNLFTIHPDGSGLHELTNYPPGTVVLSYSFSPDGQWITFAQFGVGGEPDIFTMRVDGTELGAVTRTELADSAPDWGLAA